MGNIQSSENNINAGNNTVRTEQSSGIGNHSPTIKENKSGVLVAGEWLQNSLGFVISRLNPNNTRTAPSDKARKDLDIPLTSVKIESFSSESDSLGKIVTLNKVDTEQDSGLNEEEKSKFSEISRTKASSANSFSEYETTGFLEQSANSSPIASKGDEGRSKSIELLKQQSASECFIEHTTDTSALKLGDEYASISSRDTAESLQDKENSNASSAAQENEQDPDVSINIDKNKYEDLDDVINELENDYYKKILSNDSDTNEDKNANSPANAEGVGLLADEIIEGMYNLEETTSESSDEKIYSNSFADAITYNNPSVLIKSNKITNAKPPMRVSTFPRLTGASLRLDRKLFLEKLEKIREDRAINNTTEKTEPSRLDSFEFVDSEITIEHDNTEFFKMVEDFDIYSHDQDFIDDMNLTSADKTINDFDIKETLDPRKTYVKYGTSDGTFSYIKALVATRLKAHFEYSRSWERKTEIPQIETLNDIDLMAKFLSNNPEYIEKVLDDIMVHFPVLYNAAIYNDENLQDYLVYLSDLHNVPGYIKNIFTKRLMLDLKISTDKIDFINQTMAHSVTKSLISQLSHPLWSTDLKDEIIPTCLKKFAASYDHSIQSKLVNMNFLVIEDEKTMSGTINYNFINALATEKINEEEHKWNSMVAEETAVIFKTADIILEKMLHQCIKEMTKTLREMKLFKKDKVSV